MANVSCKIQLIFLFMLIYATHYAQEKNNGYFAIPKVGIYNMVGTAFSFEGGALKNNSLVGLSYSRTRELFGQNLTNSLDMTIGKFKTQNSSSFVHAQAGIGIIWGETWETEKGVTESFSKVCLPLKVGFKYIPPHFTSVGIDFQININSEASMCMIMLTMGVWHLNE